VVKVSNWPVQPHAFGIRSLNLARLQSAARVPQPLLKLANNGHLRSILSPIFYPNYFSRAQIIALM